MSEFDKKRAKYWEERYNESQLLNSCLSIILIFLGITVIILGFN